MQEPKIWFIGYNYNFWLPVSLEGWALTMAYVLALFAILSGNQVTDDTPFVFSRHWPMLAELAAATAALYYLSKGHVDKRY